MGLAFHLLLDPAACLNPGMIACDGNVDIISSVCIAKRRSVARFGDPPSLRNSAAIRSSIRPAAMRESTDLGIEEVAYGTGLSKSALRIEDDLDDSKIVSMIENLRGRCPVCIASELDAPRSRR